MKQTVPELRVDRYPPEKPKFKSAIVLVHGLWAGSWCWQTWATHFCNLGWDCWAVDLRGRSQTTSSGTPMSVTLELVADDLTRVTNSFSSPPIVLAHSSGALVALRAAGETIFAALVLASPLPPGNAAGPRSRALRLLRLKYLPLMLLGHSFRIEEKDLRKNFLAPLAEGVQAEISRKTVVESSQLVQELLRPRVAIEPRSIRYPCLVLAGSQDQIIPPASNRALAAWLGADFKEYPDQGHWIIEANGESIVRDIHRWLVQTLGDEVLLTELC
jgi:pimeloyl-ACP methyl ester carboxylesterase